MVSASETGFRLALAATLALTLVACSTEKTADSSPQDTADTGLFEDGGADASKEPEPFVVVETSDPEDFGPCYEPDSSDAPAGHDFCPGAFCGECTYERPELYVFARASDFGEGVKFVAMKDDLLLAEDAHGKPRLFGLELHRDDPPVRLVEIPFDPAPPSDMRGRAIAGFASHDGYAVLCNEISCVVYQTEARGEASVAKRLSVMLPVDAKGVVDAFTRSTDEILKGLFCIYGDGIHCLQSGGTFATWATGEGGKLLAADESGSWLVGENGRIVRFDGKKAVEPYRGIDARLHTVTSNLHAESAWAAGEGGVVLAFGKAGPRVCKSPNHDIQAAVADWHSLMGFIDKEGSFLEAPRGIRVRWCSSPPPMENMMAFRIRPCGVVQNRWMLSPEEFRGEMHCMYD